MIKKMVYLEIMFSLLIFPLAIYAQDYNPLRKAVRGGANVLLSAAEVPRQIFSVTKNEGQLTGLFWGPLKGMLYMLGRTIVGGYEVATFIIPPYQPVVEPEFVFSEEE